MTANVFKNLLLEGKPKETKRVNFVIGLIIILMFGDIWYWISKTKAWYDASHMDEGFKYTINDV